MFTYWAPVIAWAALIFFLSSLPTLPSAATVWWDFFLKKGAHISVYAILFFLTYRAVRNHTTSKAYLITFILVFLYACSDELHQTFVPGRTGLARDVGYDTLGMSVVYLKLRGFI